MKTKKVIIAICFLCLPLCAQHEQAHHEHLGTVHFETSCLPQAQVEFDHAVALLHSFQFGRAREAFNSVLKADPKCAMAYWGIGLIEWSNPFAPGVKSESQIAAGRKAIDAGLALNPPGSGRTTSERERSYLNAVAKLYTDSSADTQQKRIEAYRDAIGDLSAKHPEDHEAAIYYALALAESEPLGDKTHAERLKAGAILEALFKQEPDHPGLAHYIIHAYDTPDLAPKAVDAARKYGKIAPDAPHALHMPSHTFTRVGYWQESIESNIAAAQAAEREHQYGEELHTMDYRVYAYLQTGQDEAARKLLEDVPVVIAKMNVQNGLASAAPPMAGHFAIAAIPARYALERQDWQMAAALKPATTPTPYADAMTWFARGIGAARLKRTKTAEESAEALGILVQKLKQAKEDYWATQVEIQRLEVAAWAAWSAGNSNDGLKTMEQAVQLEDTTDKSAVTPGPLAPARELLGEMLMQLGKPKPALAQFELTMKKEPGRFLTLYQAAQAAKQAGDAERSRDYYQKLAKICERGDKPGRKELQEARAQ
jgi:tetratricopeptide (TPR) repeat protein